MPTFSLFYLINYKNKKLRRVQFSFEMEEQDVFNVLFDDNEEMAMLGVLMEMENNNDEGERERERVYVDIQGWRELSNISFKENYRMDRIVFQNLIVALGHHLVAKGRLRRLRTPLDTILLMGLWPLFNPDTFRSSGAHFDKDRGDIHYHYRYIIKALKEMAPRYIKWPTALERITIKEHFEENYGYPGVVGCMDGVHVNITAPVEQGFRYYNRHDCYSILVQAVCDHRLLYRDIYVGEPRSIGDVRMFNRSPLCNNLLFSNDMFSRGEHLLADGAYTLTDKVIVPYIRDRNNTPRQNTHNTILSSVRSAVERSFGLLKGKNRRLKTLPMRNLEYTNWHITSCFVLHNFIMLNGEDIDGLEPQDMAVAHDEAHLEATIQEAQQLGAIKREYIAHLLHP